MDYEIRKSVKNNDVFFTIPWSPIEKADKYDINSKVPSMGGIAELYFMDKYKKLNMYTLLRSYYGGIRITLRRATDIEIEKDQRCRQILDEYKEKIYFRYALTESSADMNDIIYFFMYTYSPKNKTLQHSGRYKRIFVKETNTGKLITI